MVAAYPFGSLELKGLDATRMERLMIVIDGWIFRSEDVASVGPIVDEGNACWFEIGTADGRSYLISRQNVRELFKQQAVLFTMLAERELCRKGSR